MLGGNVREQWLKCSLDSKAVQPDFRVTLTHPSTGFINLLGSVKSVGFIFEHTLQT